MKKILVIGATGFIGRHLIRSLKGYDLVCMIRRKNAIRPAKNRKITYGDITKKEDVASAAKGADVIINLAAPNTQDREINNSVIANGARNVIGAAKANNVKRIIALGSYAARRKSLDSYGKAKKESEKLLLGSGIDTIILNPSMVYGNGGYAFGKFISSLNSVPFFVPVIGNGKYKIRPCYVGDVVNAIAASIEIKNKGAKRMDMGGPYPIEYDMFVKKALAAMGRKKRIIHLPVGLASAAAGIAGMLMKYVAFSSATIKRITEDVSMDISRAKKELRLNITGYDEGLKEVLG